ncbi:MAG TPA: PIN domain-containing protein [Pyrinomonadaceae bacterium]|nr:PIN domain-containing protein [Pyrinomonadaceae bacterium]
MAKVTYDANICISYKQSFPRSFYMSAVVLQELAAGANDASAIKELDRLRQECRKANKLLVPNEEDWWHAGLVLNSLQRGRRSKKTGRIPKISVAERYRIINDVLIARTAKRAGVMVVTDNVNDFMKIRNFCDVKIISGSKYFSSS